MANATIKYGEGNWAIGENVALAYNDTNNNFKPLPFNFTRGSEATFVNRQGLIESTNTFGSDIVTNGDFSNGSTGWLLRYSGTGDWDVTDKLNFTNANGGSRQNNVFVIGKTYKITLDYTFTSGTRLVLPYDGTNFNSSDMVITTPSSAIGYTYYYTPLSDDDLNIYTDGNGNGSIDNVSVKEVTYATNTPRIDFSNDEAGALLLEPQRTNEVSQSNDFSQWTLTDAIITSNLLTNPSGLTNTNKVMASVANSTHAIFLLPSVSSLTKYTFSLYAKSDEYERLYIRQGTGTLPSAAVYELNGNGSVLETYGSPQGTSITNVGNGWYRITLTNTTSASGANFAPNIMGIPNSGYTATADSVTFLGDGTSGLYIYGAQLEEGSYSTSYIPTNGTPNTRLGEVCSDAGNTSFINSEEGVLYAEVSALANDGTYRILSISNGTASERIYMQYTNASNTVSVVVKNGNVTQANFSYVLSNETDMNKIAIRWKLNNFSLWVNGVKVGADTNGLTPIGLSELSFDNGSGGNKFYGNTKGLQVFSEALSDAELQTLTTI